MYLLYKDITSIIDKVSTGLIISLPRHSTSLVLQYMNKIL